MIFVPLAEAETVFGNSFDFVITSNVFVTE